MPERDFLGWDEALPRLAARWLWQSAGTSTPASLEETLLLVPSRQAMNALLDALSGEASAEAFLPPRLLTPTLLPALRRTPPFPATSRIMHRAWLQILQGLTPDQLAPLLPRQEKTLPSAWIRSLAGELLSLQQGVYPHLLSFQRIAECLDTDRVRWETLARLESQWVSILEKEGSTSPLSAWNALTVQELTDQGIRRIVVVGIPDLIPAARSFLESAGKEIPISILVMAPSTRADQFDAWGAPLPEVWTGPVDFPDLDEHLHLCRSYAESAQTASRLLASEPADTPAVAVDDDALRSAICAELDATGKSYRLMSGLTGQALPITTWLHNLAQWIRSPSQAHTFPLLLHPWMLEQLLAELNLEGPDDFLSTWDALGQSCAWREIEDLDTIAPRKEGPLHLARQLHAFLTPRYQTLASDRGLNFLRDALARLPWTADCPEDDQATLREILEFWLDPACLGHLDLTDRLDLCLADLAEFRIFHDPPDGSIPLHGWIDSLWIDRPHLVLTVMQQGGVPESPSQHLFLPRQAALSLGLPDADHLHARDAYALTALIRSRQAGGRIDYVVSRSDGEGNPLLPSPLLAIAPEDQLAERVETLFSSPAPPSPDPPGPSLPLTLRPGPELAEKKISVTAFTRFLKSPFYFHLEKLSGWETLGTSRLSLDPLAYGSLCHKALELYFRETCDAPEHDAEKIAAGLLHYLDREAEQWVGKNPHIGLQIQLESMRSRLRAFSLIEAESRQQGWRPIEFEKKISISACGWNISGVIDRVDRNEDGRIRVLDYKTSESADDPAKAHMKTMRSNTRAIPEAIFEWNDKDHCWTNLQLPLYVLSQRDHYPDAPEILCGYVQLPKSLQDIRISHWEAFEPGLAEEARACARRILDSIGNASGPSPEMFTDHDRDLWHHLMGEKAFDLFDIQWQESQ